MNLLRTLLFVPGGRQNMIERARTLTPDAIVFDLEDSVPPDQKEEARRQVRAALPACVQPGRRLWVRVNSTYTNLTKADIQTVLTPEVDGIFLPKADSAGIVRYAEALLRDQEARAGIEAGKTRLIVAIESAAGLLQASEMSHASERLIGLAFGSEDFAADMEIERTAHGAELQHARGMIGLIARAARLLAIDTVYPHLHDVDGLVREAELAKQAGFQGKLLIHPEQIEPVQRVFTPSEQELASARRIVEAYRQATTEGRGAVQVDGAMVDAPVALRAQRLLDRVEAGAAPESAPDAGAEGRQGSGATPRPA